MTAPYTKTELSELLADNTEGLISPARLRAFLESAALLLPFMFGNGSDGDLVVADNTTTTLSIYKQYRTITLGENSILDTDGWQLYCQTPIVGTETSVIKTRDPANGGNGSAVAGGTAGSTSTRPLMPFYSGRNGGLNGAGTAGQSASVVPEISPPSGRNGGNASAGQAGGVGGAANVSNYYSGAIVSPLILPAFNLLSLNLTGGSSGGGGGAAGAGGGASGSPGYGIMILAPAILGGVTLRALGGNGGNGHTGSGVGGGGGGGGNGGFVVLVTQDGLTSDYTIDNAGGTGGTGGGSGAQNGTDGVVGATLFRSV